MLCLPQLPKLGDGSMTSGSAASPPSPRSQSLGPKANGLQDLVDPRHKRTKLLRSWPLTSPIARRNRKLEHLRDRVPMNAKALRRLPAAQPVHHHRASYPGIEFHCEHPFGLSMPFKDIETA